MNQQSIEWLDENAIKKALNEETKNHLTRLDIFETIDSTNTYLLTHAKDYATSGCVCLAEEQTHGRGRQGKNWFSPKGANIYCSVLWKFSSAKVDLSPLSLAIAVMVGRALQHYGLAVPLAFKWPNDIYAKQRKLAGILIESVVLKESEFLVVIGIGINTQLITAHPFAQSVISLEEITSQPIKRNHLVGLVLNALFSGLTTYEQEGFKAFQHEWEQQDMLFESEVAIQVTDRIIQGTACGIDLKGQLKVQTSDVLQLFRCGEVSVKMSDKL